MPLFSRARPVIPLDRDASGRYLPFIIAGLTVLATLMLVLCLSLSHAVSCWQNELSGKVTVQRLPLDKTAQPLPERVEAALALLRASPVVATAEPVGEAAMVQLLAPWFGQGSLPDELPVPALIDVELKPDVTDIHGLREALESVSGAQLDDHGSWMREVHRLAMLGLGVAAVLLLLIIGAAVLMLILLVQTAMEAHHEVIELLHLVGATDAFIARQLRRHMFWLSVQGTLLGGLVATGLLILLVRFATRAGLDVAVQWHLLPVMPTLLIALAVITAHHVAHRRLGELP